MKGKKGRKEKLTPEQKEALEEKRQEKLQQERERKENEKYEKYINELRQQNYRAALLVEVLKSIDAMRRAHYKKRRNQLNVRKWNEYLSCTSLPNVNDPPAVREFIYRWKKEILDDMKNNFSWVLDVDEKTMLTQNYQQKPLCFWKLSKAQPVIGNLYISRIDQCLTLLTELELVLLTSGDLALKNIKTELRTQLRDVLDQFTFRVLTNIERDMSRIDERTAKLDFKSTSFSSSLWTTRPVPQISPKWRTDDITEIEFPEIDAFILVNNLVETDGYSYRALLMNYNHFSDMASSFNLRVKFPPSPDLRTANDMEWKKREEIMHEQIDQMKSERAKWEQKEKERLLKEEEARKGKGGKGGKGGKEPSKKNKTSRKPKIGPMVVTERTVVDVTEDYLKFENDLITQQQNSMSPESLHLTENEINLREYRIVGGVYAFNYLIRPEQYVELKSQFLYKPQQSCLRLANFVANKELDLIEVRINLSESVNWWLAPVVCYWQPWEESEEFLSLSPELQSFHKNYQENMDKLEKLLFSEPQSKLKYDVVKCLYDFNLNTLPQDIDFQKLIGEYIQPRMPITYKFEVELDAFKEILRKEALRKKEIEMQKTETKLKRRSIFDKEMQKYLEQVRDNIEKTVAKMQSDFEVYCVEQRQRLINLGENELQISRFLNHKTEDNERNKREFDSDEMVKYRDYVDEQFKTKVLIFEIEDNVSVEKSHAHVAKSSPRDLYLNEPKQIPLKVINGDKVYNFDVPNENDAPSYDGPINDNILLSTFLRYLIFLFEQNKPIFKNKPKIEEKESTSKVTEDVVVIPKALPISKSSFTKIKQSGKVAKKGKGAKIKGSTKKTGKTAEKPKSASGKKKKSPRGSKKTQKIKTPIKTEVEAKPPPPIKIEDTSHGHIKGRQNKILHLVPHFPGKWIRSGINELDFDFKTREIKFQISQFGTFGFALPSYCNFPITYWELYPNTNKKHSVLLKVIGKYAEIKIEINEDGYSIERIVPNNINFVPDKTILEYRTLKIFMQECGFNIFPECDAGFYIEDISEKHRPMEDHTYYCIAQFTLSHYFHMSSYNRLSDRRIGVFELYEKLDNVKLPEKFTTILVTPQKCNIVEVSMKTPKTGQPYIDYKMVPEEQEYYPDVYNLLKSNCNELSLRYHDQMKHVHRYNVARLLSSIRPLSFG